MVRTLSCPFMIKKMKNDYWKMYFLKLPHLWHVLIINPPFRTVPSIICFPSSMKSFYKKVPPYFMGGHYALAPLENHVGVYTPSTFARKCRLMLVNTLNLAKKIIWQKRSVG